MIKNDFNTYSPAEFITVITEQVSVITEQKNQIDNLKHQVSVFQKMVFGSKQEQHKAIENPEQTSIEFTEKVDLDLPQDIEEQKTSFHRKKTNTKAQTP